MFMLVFSLPAPSTLAKLGLVMVLLLGGNPLFAQTSTTDAEVYAEGMEIMRTQGVTAGLTYFEKQPNSALTVFGIGWMFYSGGNFTKAREVTQFLTARNYEKNTLGKAYYLDGYLDIQETKYKSAARKFQRALDLYDDDKASSRFKAMMGLVTSFIFNEKIDEAEKTLAQAAELKEASKIISGYFYYLNARVAFFESDYNEALGYSISSLEEFQKAGDLRSEVGALIDIAFYTAMISKFEESENAADYAREKINEQQFPDRPKTLA